MYLNKTGSKYFTITPTYISRINANRIKTISVTCSAPKTVKRASATITITCAGAEPKTVNLSYVNGEDVTVAPVDGEVQESLGVGIEEAPDEPSQQEWNAPANTAGLDEMMMDVRIFAEGQNIIIESSTQQSAIISDLTGRARSVNLQVGRNEIPLNSCGVYVVRVGKESKKLMLR